MSVSFRVAFAGEVIEVSALHDELRTFCKDYQTNEPASFHIELTPADLLFEQETMQQIAAQEGLAPKKFSEPYLETVALHRKVAESLINADTLLFHGSCISVDGEGYLFTAVSGTGKSTHTKLWRQQFGSRAQMINDDKPLLKINRQGVTVYGSPWGGKHRLSTNASCPLKAICILTRSEDNWIHPIDRKTAFPMLFQQSYRSSDPALLKKSLVLLDQLSSSVALYKLGCNMEPEAAQVAYAGMNRSF